jgi:hypothetical protein
MRKTSATLALVLLVLTVGAGNSSLTGQAVEAAAAQDVTPGTTYYVDCQDGNDANLGTDSGQAWATLGRANRASLQPGDALRLRTDCEWPGPLNASWTGTDSRPISIDKYGLGAAPRIDGSASIMVDVTGAYQTIGGLALSATPDHIDAGCRNQAVGDRTGVYFQPGSQHNTLANTDFTRLSVGVNLSFGSAYNTVTHNVLHDVNMMFTLTPVRVHPDDDAGGQNILIEGDYNEISYNQITGAIACGYDYGGVNGQAFVLLGGRHNSIHHNYGANNNNFIEAGTAPGQPPADDNTWAFNVSVGSNFFTAHGRRTHWGPALHNRVYNNTSYSTGDGGVSCSDGCGPDILELKNNIIWADASAVLDADAPIDEGYNLFWSRNGSPYSNIPLSATSRIADPQFVNPQANDFHLQPTSPAIAAGTADFPRTSQLGADGSPGSGAGTSVAIGALAP